MLIRYIFIRTSDRSGADTEFPDADIFGSDIRPSLEGHGIFEYSLRIFENIWYLVTHYVANDRRGSKAYRPKSAVKHTGVACHTADYSQYALLLRRLITLRSAAPGSIMMRERNYKLCCYVLLLYFCLPV